MVNIAECNPNGMAKDSRPKAIQHTKEDGLINAVNHTSSVSKTRSGDALFVRRFGDECLSVQMENGGRQGPWAASGGPEMEAPAREESLSCARGCSLCSGDRERGCRRDGDLLPEHPVSETGGTLSGRAVAGWEEWSQDSLAGGRAWRRHWAHFPPGCCHSPEIHPFLVFSRPGEIFRGERTRFSGREGELGGHLGACEEQDILSASEEALWGRWVHSLPRCCSS